MTRLAPALVLTVVLLAGACAPRREDLSRPRAVSSRSRVRSAAVAGQFYPASAAELRSAVDRHLAAIKPVTLPGPPVVLVVPHAGYEYSATTAAHAYRTLVGRHYDTIVLLGPSHRVPVRGAALSPAEVWQTPLGEVPVDRALAASLLDCRAGYAEDELAHAEEHSLEVQLPFLQAVLDDFSIVPIVLGDPSPAECRRLGEALAAAVQGRKALIVASTDLAHYPPTEACAKVDGTTLRTLLSGDADRLFTEQERLLASGVPGLVCTLCGLAPVAVSMVAARELGASEAVQLHYTNSGQVVRETADRSVGYAAVAFCRRESPPTRASGADPGNTTGELGRHQQEELLHIARRTLDALIRTGKRYQPHTDDPALRKPRACFVTLTAHGQLRGCIGGLEPRGPLYLAVRDMAIAAATEDPRFRPVEAAELPSIRVEISVLSPVRPVQDPEEIVVGKHGVIVRQGGRSGVFLPQVAPEQGWDRETMLDHLCSDKAGLPPDAWRRGAQLSVFTAQVFGEEHP